MGHLFKGIVSFFQIFSALFVGFTNTYKTLLLFFSILLLGVGANIATPYVLKKIVEALYAGEREDAIWIFSLTSCYVAFWVFSRIQNPLQALISVRILEKFKLILDSRLFQKLHTLPTEYHTKKRSGEIMSALERAQKGVSSILSGMLYVVIPTTVELIFSCILLTKLYSFLYTGIIIFFIGVFITYLLKYSLKVRRRAEKNNIYHQESSNYLLENLRHFSTIRLFGASKYEQQSYCNILNSRESSAIDYSNANERATITEDVILGCSMGALMSLTVFESIYGQLTPGDVIFVNSLSLQLLLPLRFMGYFFRSLMKATIDIEYILNILLTDTENLEDPGKIKKINTTLIGVTFKNISFYYDQKSLILENVSFKILPKQKVAIVGKTGAGKSTIVNLITKLYSPMGGIIQINNTNLKNIHESNFHELICVVPQETAIFNRTLFDNLSYGSFNKCLKEVIDVAKKVELHDYIISLSQGYQTLCGENGITLSGGQKQRIGIARAILKDAPLLILDEATSSLDYQTENCILLLIKKLFKDKTVLIIAHRLSAVVNADKIIVLKDRKIVEEGTHASLLEKQGVYAQYWQPMKNINSN